MDDFKTRLIEEESALTEKLDKLDDFLMNDITQDLDDVQLALLRVQSTAMNTYLQCLRERIQRL